MSFLPGRWTKVDNFFFQYSTQSHCSWFRYFFPSTISNVILTSVEPKWHWNANFCVLTLNDETIYKLDCYWLIKSVEANLNGLDYSETSWQQSMHNFCAVCKILYLLCNIFSFGNIYFLFKLILLLQNFAHQYTNITKLINQIFGEMSQRHSHSMQFVVTKILYGRVYLDILNENLMLPLWPRVSQP